MTGEREPKRMRFEREKRAPFKPADGSWESVLVGLKDEYPENIFGMGEAEHWEPIEKKATMTLKEACFQYFLAGKGHITLATKVVESNQQIKTSISLGTMSADEKAELINGLASFLYDKYPQKYRNQIER